MANEISMTATLTASKGGLTISDSTSKAQTMNSAAVVLHETLQTVTTDEVISTGDADGATYDLIVKLQNTDATNPVFVKHTSVQPALFSILPGECFFARIQSGATSSLRLSAGVHTCRVKVQVIEAGDPTT